MSSLYNHKPLIIITWTLLSWILFPIAQGLYSNPFKSSTKGSMTMEMPESKTQHPYVTIIGGGKQEVLPFAYANHPVWIFDPQESDKLIGVPDIPDEEDEWVNPKSFTDLWIPQDSPTPVVRPAVTVLLKDGNPRYVMPGMDIYLEKNGKKWRNRGLHSFPMAHIWQVFLSVPPELLKVSLYSNQKIPDTINDAWTALSEKISVNEIFEAIVGLMADPPSELQKGFNFVTFPCPQVSPMKIPDNIQQIKVFLNDLEDPIRLLELEDGVSTGGGVVDISVTAIASAADSEYIPDIYKKLFQSRNSI